MPPHLTSHGQFRVGFVAPCRVRVHAVVIHDFSVSHFICASYVHLKMWCGGAIDDLYSKILLAGTHPVST